MDERMLIRIDRKILYHGANDRFERLLGVIITRFNALRLFLAPITDKTIGIMPARSCDRLKRASNMCLSQSAKVSEI